MDSYSSSSHVLIFPLPMQGHINSMLKLAELLCLANLKVTFLNTTHNHRLLTRFTDVETRLARYPDFRFELVPDGLPEDHPRTGGDWLVELFQGLKSGVEPILRDILLGSGSARGPRVTCLVLDGAVSFAYDVAKEAEVPVIAFRTVSACSLWTSFCIPKLIEAGELPFKDNEEMNQLVQNVLGMDSFLRRRDLPSFCRAKNISDPTLQLLIVGTQYTRKAHSLILNTFEDLEGPILSLIKAQCSRVYSIGPLNVHLKYKLGPEEETTRPDSTSSLREVDRSCIPWLDQKPNKSVVYVSFGSLTTLTKDQLIEFWVGLVQTNKYFLWVGRPDLIVNSNPDYVTPTELLEGTKKRGCIVSWAPQEEVLAHRAVGGFLTHSGWNSTLESIVAGVPMLCWPFFADQQINSRYISEVWKIGLDMKDTCDRKIVEKMVKDLMDGRRDELEKSTATMSLLAKRSITEGGSSHRNLEKLIDDIRRMSMK